MFKKHFINIFYKKVFAKNIYKITQETRFDYKHFLNIYKIAEEMKVMLKMFFKHSDDQYYKLKYDICVP